MADLPGTQRPRREYLDWYRGVAVLYMITAHLLDSWTRDPDRGSALYRQVMMVAGTGTTLFLLLAGVSVALSAGSKLRRSGDVGWAWRAVALRGLEIFALAFLFRLQAWVISGTGSPRDLLRVDILNIMGPSIVAAALIWRLAESATGRAAAFAGVTLATALLTPLVRAAPFGVLPDPVEAYIVPVSGLSAFVFFPWSGMVFAGAIAGVLLDSAAGDVVERRVNRRIVVAGALVAAAAYATSYLPSPYPRSDFWTSSPAYFFLRVGVVLSGVGLAYWWNATVRRKGTWSPLVQLGRTSLFIYWIHVELIYGVFSTPLHKSLTLAQALVACALFTGVMLICSVLKERLARRVRERSRTA